MRGVIAMVCLLLLGAAVMWPVQPASSAIGDIGVVNLGPSSQVSQSCACDPCECGESCDCATLDIGSLTSLPAEKQPIDEALTLDLQSEPVAGAACTDGSCGPAQAVGSAAIHATGSAVKAIGNVITTRRDGEPRKIIYRRDGEPRLPFRIFRRLRGGC